MKLTSAQVRGYQKNGYLVYGDLVTRAEADALRAAYLECLDRLRHEQQFKNIRAGTSDDGKTTEVYQLRAAHRLHPLFNDLIHDARLLDVVESLVGPNIRVVLAQGLYKPPHTGGVINWHQDDYYFRVDREDAVASCWLALDDAAVDNGCMWVIPGGHRQMVAHSTITQGGFEIPDVDESAAIPVELTHGQAMFHHGLMPHRTLGNHSDRHRCALAMHFMDAMAKPLGGGRMQEPPANMPIVRGRGVTW